MKKLLLFICIPAIALFSSCDDFFHTEPKGSIPLQDYEWQLNNLRISLNAVFDLMQSTDYQKSELIFGEAISDNCYNLQDNNASDLCQLLNFQFTTENPYILSRYRVNYRGISLANQVIASVPKLDFDGSYADTHKEIRYVLAQAKVMRALFYFNLVRTFGGVSIQPESPGLSHEIRPRSTADEVYAYIEKDLREACLILYRERYKTSEAGQIGIGAGLGLLMKVLAYQASPGIKLEQPNRAAKWQEAKEIGELFIDGKSKSYDQILKFSERYTESWDELCERLSMTDQHPTPETEIPGDVANIHQLVDFDKLFRLSGEYGKESLFEINHYDYSNSGTNINETSTIFELITLNTSGEIGPAPTENLINLKATDPRSLYTFTNSTSSDFFLDDDGGRCVIRWFTIGPGYAFCKYMVYPNEGVLAERNYRVMRYAEALLWYAEILNETGDQVRAVEVLNRVRSRAARLIEPSCKDSQYNPCKSCPLYEVLPYEEVKKNIQYERRIELAAEFDRWYDIVRLDLAGERMAWLAANASPDKDSGRGRWRGKYFKRGVNELFPIPQEEITVSNGVITQNFGY